MLDEDGLGARRAAVVLGWDSASASRVEGARARLKRLVERGWLVEAKPGRYGLVPEDPARREFLETFPFACGLIEAEGD
ncbi:hypothetical protein SHKM778_16730 [Streptomyces sp. KM77-8]|uniref:Transcriptional regulator n=1 Tax=Streptomyces haneummycinicus TaxID=3074435 RepID=A0AAT9HCV0_9ACTN